MSGRLAAIAIAPKKRAEMVPLDRAAVTLESGIAGDARGRRRDRQVTVIFKDDWDAACAALGERLPWTTRRANLLVEGLAAPALLGAQLQIGPVRLQVTQETKPCGLMQKAAPGLKAALKPGWRGGVCCIVLEGGEIAPGDEVAVL